MADNKWYTQTATGNIPANRRKFCAGVTWTEDQSSYNIYLYGGFGFGENATGFDDVYILSMPTFEWIKWYPDVPGASAPHGSLTCNIIDSAQMMVMGGNFTNSSACDVPNVGAQHNLNLGQLNYLDDKWFQYLPNLTNYSVPSAVLSVTGGSPNGGASNLSPPNGWSDSALSVYFSQKAHFDTRAPTRYIPASSSSSESNIAAIVGGAIGGFILLLIAALTIWWFCLRKRKQKPMMPELSHPTTTVNELTGDQRHNYNVAEPTVSTIPPSMSLHHSYHSTSHHSIHDTSPPLHSIHPILYQNQYQHQQQYPQHDAQTYYPPQQQGYVCPRYQPDHSIGSPAGTFPIHQQYFPPPEIRTSPPIPQEMPTSKTPGLGGGIHQPVPVRGDGIGSTPTSGTSQSLQKE